MSLGPSELFIVLVVALVVLGPDKLPQFARTLTKYLAEFRKFSASVQSQVDQALKTPVDERTKSDDAKSAEKGQGESSANPANPDVSGFELIPDQNAPRPPEPEPEPAPNPFPPQPPPPPTQPPPRPPGPPPSFPPPRPPAPKNGDQ